MMAGSGSLSAGSASAGFCLSVEGCQLPDVDKCQQTKQNALTRMTKVGSESNLPAEGAQDARASRELRGRSSVRRA